MAKIFRSFVSACYLSAALALSLGCPPARAGGAPKRAAEKTLDIQALSYHNFVRAPQKAAAAPLCPPAFVPRPQAQATEPVFSFGGDDDDGSDSAVKRPDGGLDKNSSPSSVGLRHSFSNNWQIGGAALFGGKTRGAQADLGFKW